MAKRTGFFLHAQTNKLHFPRIITPGFWFWFPAGVWDVRLRSWKSSSPAALNLYTLQLAIKLTAGAGAI